MAGRADRVEMMTKAVLECLPSSSQDVAARLGISLSSAESYIRLLRSQNKSHIGAYVRTGAPLDRAVHHPGAGQDVARKLRSQDDDDTGYFEHRLIAASAAPPLVAHARDPITAALYGAAPSRRGGHETA
jgi:hypothetical protein